MYAFPILASALALASKSIDLAFQQLHDSLQYTRRISPFQNMQLLCCSNK